MLSSSWITIWVTRKALDMDGEETAREYFDVHERTQQLGTVYIAAKPKAQSKPADRATRTPKTKQLRTKLKDSGVAAAA